MLRTYLLEQLRDLDRKEPGNIYIPFSIAYLLSKEGKTEEANIYYNKLLNINQKDMRIRVINNLGNLYYSTGNYEGAIAYYKEANKESPASAIPVYNLSQAYREKLMFNEAERSYEAAKKIDSANIDMYTHLSAKGSGYRVIDYTVTMGDLWKAAIIPADDADILARGFLRSIIKIPAERFPFLGISIIIILSILSYIKPRTPMAYYCPQCHSNVCGWCTGSRIFGAICKKCRKKEAPTHLSPSGGEGKVL